MAVVSTDPRIHSQVCLTYVSRLGVLSFLGDGTRLLVGFMGDWIRALLLPSLQSILAKAMIKMPDLAESIASAMVCDLELIMMP